MDPTKSFRVQPRAPSSLIELRLSSLEQTKPRVYTRTVSFFKTRDGVNVDYVTDLLRQSLSCVLVEFPALAGKIVLEDSDRGWVTCEIGPDEHAVLHSCDYTRGNDDDDSSTDIPTFADLENEGFPQTKLSEKLLQPPELSQPDANKRVLMAQATFIPGGVLLMTAFHHSAVDGGIRAMTYRRWSHYCKLASERQPMEPQQPSPELLDRRKVLHGQSATRPREHTSDFKYLTEQDMQSKNPLGKWINNNSTTPAPVISTMFVISRAKLNELKAAAHPPDTNSEKRWVSTMDALIALIWRAVTQSRLRAGREISTTMLGLGFSFRDRMDSIPKGYTGITAMMQFLSRPADEIAQESLPHALQATAQAVRQLINDFSPEHLFAELAVIESFPDVRRAANSIKPHLGPDLIITDTRDASRAAAQDWGPDLGPSLAMRRFPGIMEGIICINNEYEDGSLEFEIPLEQPCMDQLCRDEEFLGYASIRCR